MMSVLLPHRNIRHGGPLTHIDISFRHLVVEVLHLDGIRTSAAKTSSDIGRAGTCALRTGLLVQVMFPGRIHVSAPLLRKNIRVQTGSESDMSDMEMADHLATQGVSGNI